VLLEIGIAIEIEIGKIPARRSTTIPIPIPIPIPISIWSGLDARVGRSVAPAVRTGVEVSAAEAAGAASSRERAV